MPENASMIGHSADPQTRASLFWPIFWFLAPMLRATLLQRRRSMENFAQVDGSNIWGILVVFGAFLFVVMQKRDFFRNFKSMPIFSLFVYYVFCSISFLWGGLAYMPYTVFRAFEMCVIILTGAILASRFPNPKVALQYGIRLCFFMGIVMIFRQLEAGSMVLAAYHTNIASVPPLAGSLLYFSGVYFKMIHARENLFSGCFCVFLMLLGTSSGTIVAFAVGLVLICAFNRKSFSITKLIFILCVVYFTSYFLRDFYFSFFFPDKSPEKVMSFSGRLIIWDTYLRGFMKSPLWGYGFPIGEKLGYVYGFKITTSAHNGFVSVLINTGIVGAFLFLAFLLGFYSFLRNNKSPFASILFVVFTALLVNNNTVPLIGSHFTGASLPVILIAAMNNSFLLAGSQNNISEK